MPKYFILCFPIFFVLLFSKLYCNQFFCAGWNIMKFVLSIFKANLFAHNRSSTLNSCSLRFCSKL